MKSATVRQTRRLRDGRQLHQIDACPHCGESHWIMTDGSTVARCVAAPDRAFWLDGLGQAAQQ